jgi:hypothetical protein
MGFNFHQIYRRTHQLNGLTDQITEQEIQMVIQTWPSHKTPGPDRLTGEFYRKFQQMLLSNLVQT